MNDPIDGLRIIHAGDKNYWFSGTCALCDTEFETGRQLVHSELSGGKMVHTTGCPLCTRKVVLQRVNKSKELTDRVEKAVSLMDQLNKELAGHAVISTPPRRSK